MSSVMPLPSVYTVVSDDRAALSQAIEGSISLYTHVVILETLSSSSVAIIVFDVAMGRPLIAV